METLSREEVAAYLVEQEFNAVLQEAVNRVVRERPTNGISRLAEILAEKARLQEISSGVEEADPAMTKSTHQQWTTSDAPIPAEAFVTYTNTDNVEAPDRSRTLHTGTFLSRSPSGNLTSSSTAPPLASSPLRPLDETRPA